jgi:hypothetical protein
MGPLEKVTRQPRFRLQGPRRVGASGYNGSYSTLEPSIAELQRNLLGAIDAAVRVGLPQAQVEHSISAQRGASTSYRYSHI